VLGIASPDSGGVSDLEAVPNPVIHSCQILDAARDVERIEVVQSEILKLGARMGYSRSKVVDAEDRGRDPYRPLAAGQPAGPGPSCGRGRRL
jgi:hypothetical protein